MQPRHPRTPKVHRHVMSAPWARWPLGRQCFKTRRRHRWGPTCHRPSARSGLAVGTASHVQANPKLRTHAPFHNVEMMGCGPDIEGHASTWKLTHVPRSLPACMPSMPSREAWQDARFLMSRGLDPHRTACQLQWALTTSASAAPPPAKYTAVARPCRRSSRIKGAPTGTAK